MILKYLFKKNIQSDEDYKMYQLLWLPLILLLDIAVCFIMYQQLGYSSKFWGGVVGVGIPLICYVIWLYLVLRNPKRLRAARLRLTDERRKIIDQAVFADIGRLMLILIMCLMLATVFWGPIKLDVYPLILMLYAMLIYWWFRLRK